MIRIAMRLKAAMSRCVFRHADRSARRRCRYPKRACAIASSRSASATIIIGSQARQPLLLMGLRGKGRHELPDGSGKMRMGCYSIPDGSPTQKSAVTGSSPRSWTRTGRPAAPGQQRKARAKPS
jgi:hypothetical protein